MTLVRWEPFRRTAVLRHPMDRWFEDGFLRPAWHATNGASDLDIYQDGESLVVKAAVPGVKPDEVKITVTGNHLAIEGEAKDEEEQKEMDYLVRERRYGAYHRTVTLPTGLNTEKAEASLENGVLTLTIPRAEESKAKHIKVKA